jgi:alanine racemase
MIYNNILEINLSTIKDNYRYLSKIVSSNIAPVLKANAYGLGVENISRALIQEGCKDFFVSSLDEALELRYLYKENINIYVLSGLIPMEMEQARIYKIIPVINHLDQLENYNNFSKTVGEKLPAILHFDTGMNRLGMEKGEILKIIDNKDLISSIEILYIMSHLSVAEDSNNLRNREQREKFIQYAKHFKDIPLSLANSSGIFLGKEYHFDMVRPGASIYGINPFRNKPNPMQNPVSLKSYILQLRNIKKGEYVGYGNNFKASRDKKVAVISIGYADGYKRVDTSKSYVIIEGEKAKIIGNISMDYTTIDVTDISSHKLYLGASVEIIGENIHQDILGVMQNTIGYEVLTSLGNRYKRLYVDK